MNRILFLVIAFIAVFACGCGDSDVAAGQFPMDFCDGVPPDADCYSRVRDPAGPNIALAGEILDRYIELYPVETLGWEWEATVLMTGVYELYRVTGQQEYLDYMADWMDYNIQGTPFMWSSDSASPALIAAFLYFETGDEKYRDIVFLAFDYLENFVTRTEDGGLNHWGAADIPGPTLWLDTLFMVGTMLTRWGEFIDDSAPLDEMALQIQVFTNRLQSSGGLYVHAFNWSSEIDTDIYWGRGNGWVCAAGFDYVRARIIRGEIDPVAEDALKRQAAAAVTVQDQETGLWPIVLNRPETYLETSTAALFAYGMARAWRYGILGDEYLSHVHSAMQGVISTITYDEQDRPVVSNVSGPTEAGTLEYYTGLPLLDDLGYGVGTVLLALVETSGLPAE